MTGAALVLFAWLAAAQGEPRPTTYIAYVASPDGRCVYQTGDVLFDRTGFASDLMARFDPAARC